MRSPIAFPSAFPHALIGSVKAEAASKDVIAQIRNAVEDFKGRYDDRLTGIEASMNEKLAWAYISGGGGGVRPEDPEYSAAFANYFRKGDDEATIKAANSSGYRAHIQAAMSVGTADQGGYLAPTEWDRRISQAQLTTSAMRRLASVQVTTVSAYSTLWNNRVWGSGWVGETAARPETTSPTLSAITFGHGEIYANPAITQRLLDDAQFGIETWLANQIETEFNIQEDAAFLSGNGVNKPFGFLQYIAGGAGAAQHPAGTLGITTAASATVIAPDELVTFTYALSAPYRQNASWLMNSATAATIGKLKDGQGNYLWRESMAIGQPATLLGRPIEIDEGMPSIATGTYPIAFGDFKAGYIINDRTGSRILRDPFSAKPYVMFYCTKRVGGGVADPNAIRLFKMA
jgi:HK97 family phage major capsid protein